MGAVSGQGGGSDTHLALGRCHRRGEEGGGRFFFMSLSRSFFSELAAITAAATSMAAVGIYELGESIGDKSASSPGKDAVAAAALGALIDDLSDPSPNPPPFYKRDSSGHFLAICCLHLPPPPPSPNEW